MRRSRVAERRLAARIGRAMLLLALAGCGGHRAAPITLPPADAGSDVTADAATARTVVSLFIAAEAQNDAAADTLLAPGADFLMTDCG